MSKAREFLKLIGESVDPIIGQIAKAVEGKKLVDMRNPLESIFNNK